MIFGEPLAGMTLLAHRRVVRHRRRRDAERFAPAPAGGRQSTRRALGGTPMKTSRMKTMAIAPRPGLA